MLSRKVPENHMPPADVVDAVTKLSAAPFEAPGPMVGARLRPDPKFQRDDTLQAALKTALPADLVKHAMAVVDLSVDRTKPFYAAFNDTDRRWIASLAKLLPMYGMYQLRADVRWAAQTLGTTDLMILGPAIRKHYALFGASTATRPMIETLFTKRTDPVTSKDSVELTANGVDDATLEASYEGNDPSRRTRIAPAGESAIDTSDAVLETELGRLPAQELLRLMIGWSDDSAAAVVTESLGFPYLLALAKRSGLFRESWPALRDWDDHHRPGSGGLCLQSDYYHGHWRNPAKSAPTGTTQMGTTRSVATLLTLLAQDALVDDGAQFGHVMMREMMRKVTSDSSWQLRGEFSPLGTGVDDFDPTFHPNQPPASYISPPRSNLDADFAMSKIGLAQAPIHDTKDSGGAVTHHFVSNASNALLVQMTHPTSTGDKRIEFVLVASCNDTDVSDETLKSDVVRIGTAMMSLIRTRYDFT